MSHPEACTVVFPADRLSQVAITHDASEDQLPLRRTEQVRLSEHDTVADGDLTSLAPASGGAHQVIPGEIHDGPAMSFTASGPFHYEMQELISGAVIEPVDNLFRHDFAEFRVIGQNLNLHFIVYNLAY